MNFLRLELKCLNFYCFMLQSQKMKCLVLSRYPHSDPHIKVIRRFGSFHRQDSCEELYRSQKGYYTENHYEYMEGSLQGCSNPLSRFEISCNPVIPMVVFGIPHLAQTSNPESRSDFDLKSRKTYWIPSMASNASFHFRWLAGHVPQHETPDSYALQIDHGIIDFRPSFLLKSVEVLYPS